MRLLATYYIEGVVRLLTGLHIGSGDQGVRIGGIDNPVIKTINNEPYIPGSSLKGKIRSEFEWRYGNVEDEANRVISEYDEEANKKEEPTFDKLDKKRKIKVLSKVRACNCGVCNICKIFGHTNTNEVRPTRAIFRDLYLKDRDRFQTEVKSENTISRITSEATPRQIERVPANTEFDLRIIFNAYDEGDKDLLKVLFEGLVAVEETFLGGGGSRGNGQVEFKEIKISKRLPNMVDKTICDITQRCPVDIVKSFEKVKKKL